MKGDALLGAGEGYGLQAGPELDELALQLFVRGNLSRLRNSVCRPRPGIVGFASPQPLLFGFEPCKLGLRQPELQPAKIDARPRASPRPDLRGQRRGSSRRQMSNHPQAGGLSLANSRGDFVARV